MSRQEIEETLKQIPAGTEVRLKLSDGSEVVGTLQEASDGDVTLSDEAEAVDLDQVEGVLLDGTSEGPE